MTYGKLILKANNSNKSKFSIAQLLCWIENGNTGDINWKIELYLLVISTIEFIFSFSKLLLYSY